MSDQGPREHAEHCVSRAHNAPSTLERTLHLLMADAWMKLANASERYSGEGSAKAGPESERKRQLAV